MKKIMLLLIILMMIIFTTGCAEQPQQRTGQAWGPSIEMPKFPGYKQKVNCETYYQLCNYHGQQYYCQLYAEKCQKQQPQTPPAPACDLRANLGLNNPQIYLLEGIQYQTEVIYISSTSAKLNINGEVTEPLGINDYSILADGTRILINNLIGTTVDFCLDHPTSSETTLKEYYKGTFLTQGKTFKLNYDPYNKILKITDPSNNISEIQIDASNKGTWNYQGKTYLIEINTAAKTISFTYY